MVTMVKGSKSLVITCDSLIFDKLKDKFYDEFEQALQSLNTGTIRIYLEDYDESMDSLIKSYKERIEQKILQHASIEKQEDSAIENYPLYGKDTFQIMYRIIKKCRR